MTENDFAIEHSEQREEKGAHSAEHANKAEKKMGADGTTVGASHYREQALAGRAERLAAT